MVSVEKRTADGNEGDGTMNEYYATTAEADARVAELARYGWITYPSREFDHMTVCKRTANCISPIYVWAPLAA
jgi:hypothetical protein